MDEVKAKGEEYYRGIGSVQCPYFKAPIIFNRDGLEHLKFKSRSRARPRQDQYMRFKLLELASQVLRATATLQGLWNTKKFEKTRVNSRTELQLKDIVYYEFVAVVGKVRVKIIVKQIGSGPYIFWSLIPYWGLNPADKTRKLHSGYPEDD